MDLSLIKLSREHIIQFALQSFVDSITRANGRLNDTKNPLIIFQSIFKIIIQF